MTLDYRWRGHRAKGQLDLPLAHQLEDALHPRIGMHPHLGDADRAIVHPVRQGVTGKDPLSQGEKIPVVEDDPEVRALTVKMLASLGYETVEAVDGKEAIEVLQRTPGVDLLFTDIGLPGGMSGVDIAREATRHSPDIRILFTSGYAEDILARHGGIDTNVQLVHKPFLREELAQKLRSAMGQSLN